MYKALETFMNGKGKNGRECLLKAICDAAQSPIQRDGGVFSEIAHLILR